MLSLDAQAGYMLVLVAKPVRFVIFVEANIFY